MFEGLAEKLQETFKKLRGKGKLTEKDLNSALREVRLALLEADVSLPVVKEFIQRIRERSLGADVLESFTPAQQVIKIVNEELTAVMGDTKSSVEFNSSGATVFLLVGLQGGGKNYNCGEIGSALQEAGKTAPSGSCRCLPPCCDQAA